MYLHTCFGELAQHLPALRPVGNRPRLVSGELYRRCLLLTTGPSCVPAAYEGELAHCLTTLPPVANQPWTCTCLNTRASWCRLTGVASCRQAALDMYLHVCFSELAQHRPALRPIDDRLRLVSGELAQRQLTLSPVDNQAPDVYCPSVLRRISERRCGGGSGGLAPRKKISSLRWFYPFF